MTSPLPEWERSILMGKASWTWDDELNAHVPTCSRWKVGPSGMVVRCDSGPLKDEEISEGTCSEGPHLPREVRT